MTRAIQHRPDHQPNITDSLDPDGIERRRWLAEVDFLETNIGTEVAAAGTDPERRKLAADWIGTARTRIRELKARLEPKTEKKDAA